MNLENALYDGGTIPNELPTTDNDCTKVWDNGKTIDVSSPSGAQETT